MALSWSREDLVRDRDLYLAEIERMKKAGLPDEHPSVKLWVRRVAVVDRLLDRGEFNP